MAVRTESTRAPGADPAPAKQPERRRKWSRMRRSDVFWGYAMIAPSILGILAFSLWPITQTVYLSFTESEAFGNQEWVGLANYAEILQDEDFRLALRNTLVYTVLSVVVTQVIALLLAVLLNQKLRGMSFYRTLFFLPVVTMPAATALVWNWLYNSEHGLINYALSFLGIPGVAWLTNPNTALYAIIVVGIWGGIGYAMVLFLAGLQTIPGEYYDAASVDGAGAVTRFFRITLPLLSRTIFFVTVVSLINAFQVFDLVYMMVGGGGAGGALSPVIKDTQSVVYLFYRHSFVMNERGYGAAIILILFALIMVLTLVQLRLQRRWVHYE